jgi:hypothetical protein
VLELQILAANVLLPIGVMLLALAATRWLPGRIRNEGPELASEASISPGANVLLVFASVASIWLAFGVRVDFALWPDDVWARMPQAVAIVGAASILTIWLSAKTPWPKLSASLINACGLAAAALVVFPTGEAWEFLIPRKNAWLALLVLGPWVAWWCADQLAGKRAATLGFGWILCIAASAVLSSDFIRVTEPMLAMAAVVGCASLACLRIQHAQYVATVATPSIFGMSAATANAQFNSYADLPDPLFWCAIALPAFAALIAMTVLRTPLPKSARRTPDEGPIGWKRVILMLAVCLIFAICIVAWKLLVSNASGGEDWSDNVVGEVARLCARQDEFANCSS